MSDVDIDLKNAQEALLAQGKEVTVQSLSNATGGTYGNELIAGWLQANPGECEESHEGWLEHWLAVGSASSKAVDALESLGCKVEYGRSNHSGTPIVLVCLLYDEPEDNERGFTIDEVIPLTPPHGGAYLEIEISSPDKPYSGVFIVCSKRVAKAKSIIQESVTDLELITQGEWFDRMEQLH